MLDIAVHAFVSREVLRLDHNKTRNLQHKIPSLLDFFVIFRVFILIIVQRRGVKHTDAFLGALHILMSTSFIHSEAQIAKCKLSSLF